VALYCPFLGIVPRLTGIFEILLFSDFSRLRWRNRGATRYARDSIIDRQTLIASISLKAFVLERDISGAGTRSDLCPWNTFSVSAL
jgi:hypothetical protein